MRRSFIAFSVIAIFICGNAFAAEYHLLDNDFAAPSVPSSGALTNQSVGSIVYDQSTNQFKGYDSTGSWDAMTVPGVALNVSSSNSGQVRVESALINISGASTCSVVQQTGNWITTPPTGGGTLCALSFETGEFSGNPVCVATAFGATNSICRGANVAATTSGWTMGAFSSSNSPQIEQCYVICMGTH